jgi:hypothetical protein
MSAPAAGAGCFPATSTCAARPGKKVLAQQEERNPLCDEFLDLCSIHGESNPGERKLARAFLERIERGEVGAQPEGERRPW